VIVNVKIKVWNELDGEADLRCAISATKPRTNIRFPKSSYTFLIDVS